MKESVLPDNMKDFCVIFYKNLERKNVKTLENLWNHGTILLTAYKSRLPES